MIFFIFCIISLSFIASNAEGRNLGGIGFDFESNIDGKIYKRIENQSPVTVVERPSNITLPIFISYTGGEEPNFFQYRLTSYERSGDHKVAPGIFVTYGPPESIALEVNETGTKILYLKLNVTDKAKIGKYKIPIFLDWAYSGSGYGTGSSITLYVEGDFLLQSPLMQFKSGISAQDVKCNEGLQLVIKSKDDSPACVRYETAIKLVSRGWASEIWSPPTIPTDLSHVVIKLERTACFGFCPIYSVSIHGNGTVNYDGINFVETNGTKTYDIPVEQVKKLVTLIYEIDYFSLDDRYEAQVTDLPSAITTITIGDQTKSVYNYGNAGPQKLQNLEQKIDEIAESYKLVGTELN